MSDSRIWLVTEEFAAMAGISPQAANKAIRASDTLAHGADASWPCANVSDAGAGPAW
jgi:hypothetical protein